jgi:hypothetical protein
MGSISSTGTNNLDITHKNKPEMEATYYKPINTHPNPYGAISEFDHSLFEEVMDSQQQQQQQQRLPSRDIPKNTIDYTNDQEVQPNYIPPPISQTTKKLTSDYIKEYEENEEEIIKKHEEEKSRGEVAEDLFSQLQLPILAAVMFFIFNMSFISNLAYKYLYFLPLFRTDGTLNIYGMMMKSSLFGSTLFSLTKIINFLTYL